MENEYSLIPLTDEIVLGATEALELRDDMAALGMESREVDWICDDLQYAASTIKTLGLKAYFYLSDNQDALAERFGIKAYEKGVTSDALAKLEAEHISAATEGLKEYLARFVQLIKTIYEKLKTWVQTVLSHRELYMDLFRKSIDSISALEGQTVISSVMNKNDAYTLLETIEKLHQFIKSIPDPSSSSFSINTNNSNMVDIFSKLGLVFDIGQSGGSFYVSNGEKGLAELYPTVGDTTLVGANWSPSSAKTFVQRLVALESLSKFKDITSSAEKHVKKMLDDTIKDAKTEDESDSGIATLVRTRGSTVRMLSKLIVVEHSAVMYCCKTARMITIRANLEAVRAK